MSSLCTDNIEITKSKEKTFDVRRRVRTLDGAVRVALIAQHYLGESPGGASAPAERPGLLFYSTGGHSLGATGRLGASFEARQRRNRYQDAGTCGLHRSRAGNHHVAALSPVGTVVAAGPS